jgi:phosphatidylinositol phospholipase C delta
VATLYNKRTHPPEALFSHGIVNVIVFIIVIVGCVLAFSLRGMVVVKGRRPLNMDIDDYDDDNSDDGAPSTIYTGDGSNMLQQQQQHQQQQQLQKSVQHRVSPALARLTLFHGAKLKGWDISVMNPTHHMHSFSENKVRSLCRKSDRRKWTIYNQSHMSRCYPAASRVDSSNYIPILPWSVGTQMVALNFQTVDTSLLLNDGRFRENGGCGYVLKPSQLIDLQDQTQSIDSRASMKLHVRVLSGACIPKASDTRAGDCTDPYVKVSVYDVRNGDREAATTYSTSVVTANGFFPIWNGEKFSFRIENQAVAMLHLCVYDKKSSLNATSTDVFVGSASIPVSCLRRGLRSVKLFDTSNTRSGAVDFASLLVDITQEREEFPMAEI